MLLPPHATLTQLTFPPSPLDLIAAKAYLRVEVPDDDELIGDLVEAATTVAIQGTGRSLLTTSWELRLDYLPFTLGLGAPFWAFPSIALCGSGGADPAIQLPRPPLISVQSINLLDQDGVERTLDPAAYVVSPGSPGRLAPAYGQIFPFSRPQINSVSIRYQAGFGDEPAAVPRNIIAAIRLITSHLYEHRSDDAPLPAAVDALLKPSWWPTYA